MSQTPDLTDEQRANLATLAAYLRTLPAEYPDFGMETFTNAAGQGCGWHDAYVPACGTAACAAGHGPHAGIEPVAGESWEEYTTRTLIDIGEERDGWEWCFSGDWSEVDNTAHGAAARIERMLAFGIPDDADDQRLGHAPLSYRLVTAA